MGSQRECSNTCIRQNRFQVTKSNNRQKWMLYNNKRDNPSKRQHLFICTKPEALKYIKQITDLKGKMDRNITVVGDFNAPFTPVDKASREQVDEETLALNDT